MMRLFSLINFITFQLCWFVSATYQQSGILIIISLLCIHFALSPQKKADIKVLPIALIGIAVDQLLIAIQVIQLPENSMSPLVIPIWLMFLWCAFAWCLNHSLQWLIKLSTTKVGVIGAIFGSLSYYVALQLNVFNSVLSPLYFALAMAFIWALLLPLFTRIHRYIFRS
ncbi:DUF2878 domain-containing protein [Colwellia sp. UCD-KL20]|uniref:DUF2878 domain-containing protein n=1 Tax=Colwellia sp. UCD-KL20 TaxID=1917165 RepID=UPI0015C344D3|nr:DUF2878 domain-containing protein [Colwellia sp. UCD-KL20]